MKRRIMIAVCMAFLLITGLLSGCAASADPQNTQNTSEERLQIVTTIFPQYDFARNIAGDCADIYMLLKPGEEVHSYEPTPQDIRLIQNCSLFIYTGGENDVWVENILASVGDEGPATVRLLDLVDTYAEEHLEGMMPEKGDHDHGEHEETEAHSHDTHEEDEEESHGSHEDIEEHEDHEDSEEHSHSHEEEPDEHVWTSPENCVILIEKLTEKICELDPANASSYRKNGDAYRAEFEKLDNEYREMVETASRRIILFGDRFPFRYLAEELGLTCYAAFSGCSAESEPSAATIAFLISKAAEEELPVVFKIEFSNGNIARAVSEAAQARIMEQTGLQMTVRVLQLHSCHNLTRDEFVSGETCLSLMKKNLEALREALN